jgi:hypothetical protein
MEMMRLAPKQATKRAGRPRSLLHCTSTIIGNSLIHQRILLNHVKKGQSLYITFLLQ